MTEPEYVIRFENAEIAYENVLLSDINLEIRKGEFAYLIGKTGTGKSSLLRTIYADIPLSKGVAEVCGFNITKIKKRNIAMLRRHLGIVFQDFQLLQDRSVMDNIAFVLRSTGWKNKQAIRERVMRVLEEVDLAEKVDSKIFKLSEGERQRVGIARALANEPEVIIADEPTGNLDPITSEQIINLLMEICEKKGTTILIATHDYIVLKKYPARTIAIEDGKITG
ncbi:MAG: ATP-binding cassette domain-containing protein [Bacteroidales bacterium]|jgi:cell division transport system ATP-binding protein|nr:ATP-binding cassette domain-containing protein [Bacteroidales bacterium]